MTQSAAPGVSTSLYSTEGQVYSTKIPPWLDSVVLDSTCVDARSTPTTIILPGLVLGKITSSGNHVQYNPAATDGSQVADCVVSRQHGSLLADGCF